MNRDKVIDKITKLQAQVEGTNVEAEALAFGAAAQRLMLEHDIEDADIEAHKRAGTVRQEEPVIEQPVNLAALGIAHSGKRNAALEDLCMFVGKAHLCKTLIRAGSNWVGLVGTESHIKVAELVIASMWRSLNKMAAQGLRQAKRDGADIRNYTRTFRQSFVWRLEARYAEERRQVIAEQDALQSIRTREARGGAGADVELGDFPTPAQSTALIVVNRELERVGSYISAHYKGRARSIGGGYSRGNNRAQTDGQRAANSVPLRSNAVSGGGRGQLSA